MARLELESEKVLEGARKAGTPFLGRHVCEVRAVDQDAAFVRLVHSAEKLHQGAFTRTVFADDGDYAAGRKFEIHVFERPAGGTRIGEANMFQTNALSQPCRYGGVRIFSERRRVVLEPGETARAVQPDATQETDLAYCCADVR